MNNKRKITVYIACIVIGCLILGMPLYVYHQSLNDYLNNVLNGSVAIIPATGIVIWQVRSENKEKRHDIENLHNDEIKKSIYQLLACMDSFPNLFNLRYRIGLLEGTSSNYERVYSLKPDIILFKNEFHKLSNKVQGNLVYLSDNDKQQKNIANIFVYRVNIEQYLQKLTMILDENNLQGDFGYTEKDYEEVILNMYELKKCLNKLPNEISLNNTFLELNTQTLSYYYLVIKVAKKQLDKIYKIESKLSVANIKNNLDKNIQKDLIEKGKKVKIFNDSEPFRDCLKIWALRKDVSENTVNYGKIQNRLIVTLSKEQKASNYTTFE